jgi:hypothetical protein
MSPSLIPIEQVDAAIVLLRGQRVMLDASLAELYGVEVKVLVQAVRRNIERFPEDFMFQLTARETERLRSQPVTLDAQTAETTNDFDLRSQSVTSRSWGGRRYHPYAFTEQGVAMLSSVLRSPRAVKVNVEIMRAFVRLRRLLQSNAELAAKLMELEKKYDGQFKIVFDAIRELMTPPETPRRTIGFGA